MNTVGYMSMPDGFRYREVFMKGKLQHEMFDKFSVRHPKMDVGKRAKIFAPFDALKGFNEAIADKEIPYVRQKELSDEDKAKLGHQLNVLHSLTYNSHLERQNFVTVTVTYFEPCSDPNSEAYGIKGLYQTVTGICWKVDAEVEKEIIIASLRIDFGRIYSIEYGDCSFLFGTDSGYEC